MPGESTRPQGPYPETTDEGTQPVLREHYPPARNGEEPDSFRARLQAAVEQFGLGLDQLPGRLLVPNYDAVIIGDQSSDLDAMLVVRNLVRDGVRYNDGTAPRVLVNETLAGESGSFLSWLNEANRRSTFLFIYVTESFLRNAERLRFIEQLYNESVSGPPERRHRIVPVFAPGVSLPDNSELTIPETALFRNMPDLPLEWDASTGRPVLRQRQIEELSRMLRDRLGHRQRRDDAQIEQVRSYAASVRQQQGAHLLQQMTDFFTTHMKCTP